MQTKPDLAIIGVPQIYLSIFQKNLAWRVNALKNMGRILKIIPICLYDHHLLRMKDWADYCSKTFNNLRANFSPIQTFAAFLNRKENLLEAKRKDLYKLEPITKEFQKWLSLD